MAACPSCGTESPDAAKFCAECGARLTPAEAPERFRKTVTILFSDVVGSTALGERLDPETLSRMMGDYFEAVKPVVVQHGGTLAKFIGDAVMAVFGLAELHEDDALRAAKAALEMRDTLAALNPELERRYGVALATRTGINTGPVAGVGLVPDRNFVGGDTANTAARLQTSAGENEILLGRTSHRLVRDWVDAELLPPLEAKGKAEPLTVYRLAALLPEGERLARQIRTPLVGRQRELAELTRFFHLCRDERACRIASVVGPPGVGKSRLVVELATRAAEEALVIEGRCLPYGEGITYWPLAQMVRQAAAIDEADAGEAALSKLNALAGDSAVAERVGQAIGLLETGASADEIPWAVRQLLETVASARPLVCVCDDIQWAEPALLNLLEEVTARSHGSPILICCLARPELLELRPDWPGVIRLDPLSEPDGDELLARLVGERTLSAALRDRITAAAAGNPLFIEQFAAMLIEEGMLAANTRTLPVPPTLQALLTARLERLGPEERQVLTRAAVAGQTFYLGALRELVPAPLLPDVHRVLLTLVRKEFLLPARSDLGTEIAYQFRHLLIRDVAYEFLTKEDRSELHERFGRWLEHALAERPDEVEEIVGHHLEQAHRFRAELAPIDERGRALADEAAERLSAAGRRAASRGDSRAAARLLSRAAALLDVGDLRRPDLLVDAAGQLRVTGLYADATAAIDEAVALRPEERLATRATLARLRIRFESDPDLGLDVIETEARKAAALADELDDHGLAAEAWTALSDVSWARCRFEATAEAETRAAEHAERAGNSIRTHGVKLTNFNCAALGPMPVLQAIALGEETLEGLNRQPLLASGVLSTLGHLHAMRGEFELARQLVLSGLATRDEGSALAYAGRAGSLGWEVEARSGNWEAAEREIRVAYDGLVALGNSGFGATAAATLAHCLLALGRMDEAEEFVVIAAETAAAEDVLSQVVWRTAHARFLAARGELKEAARVAHEAVELVQETDALGEQGEALLHLAEVLRLAACYDDAREAAQQALHVFKQKEHLVGADRAKALLVQLDRRAAPVAE
jgi:class 3 adenylate cyclase/tetratricopeptide (TPR) repeat protein